MTGNSQEARSDKQKNFPVVIMNSACSLRKKKQQTNKTKSKQKPTNQKKKISLSITCINLFLLPREMICRIMNLDLPFRLSKDQSLYSTSLLLLMVSVPHQTRYLLHELCINIHTYICIHTYIRDHDLFIIIKQSG